MHQKENWNPKPNRPYTRHTSAMSFFHILQPPRNYQQKHLSDHLHLFGNELFISVNFTLISSTIAIKKTKKSNIVVVIPCFID